MSSDEGIEISSDSPEPIQISKEDQYFRPSPSKIIRVLTVVAYILSVSMAAILLSIYYIFMWSEQRHYKITEESVLLMDIPSPTSKGKKKLT